MVKLVLTTMNLEVALSSQAGDARAALIIHPVSAIEFVCEFETERPQQLALRRHAREAGYVIEEPDGTEFHSPSFNLRATTLADAIQEVEQLVDGFAEIMYRQFWYHKSRDNADTYETTVRPNEDDPSQIEIETQFLRLQPDRETYLAAVRASGLCDPESARYLQDYDEETLALRLTPEAAAAPLDAYLRLINLNPLLKEGET